jgi:GNAT superfamily N-acetyltransferase
MPNVVHIRKATKSDAPCIARLSGEHGYPASEQEIVGRLIELALLPTHLVLVAEIHGQGIGWASGEIRVSLETGRRAEVTGLVVDSAARRGGIGRKLVAGLELWAKEHECGVIMVRSNVTRPESHPFYEKLGYLRAKTQHVYKRVLHAA